jgi:hypothetical protein
MQEIFIKKCFLLTVGSVCRIKRFTTGSRNSQGRSKVADDARPGRPFEIATEAPRRRVDSSRQKNNDRQCSNCTRMFPWFSIQHNVWSFEVPESVRVPRELKGREKWTQRTCPCNVSYGMQMKEKICLNKTVTADESWVHHYQPESKRASVQWKHPSSHSLWNIKFKIMASAKKIMPTVFCDSQGVL